MRTAGTVAGMAVLAVLGLAEHAQSAGFVLGRWSGSLEGMLDLSTQDITTGDAPKSEFDNLRAEELLRLRNVGLYIYDPRLISINAGGTFGLSQLDFTSPTESEFRNGDVLGYDLFASVLSQKPFSVTAFANRLESFPPIVGGRSSLLTESQGARLYGSQLFIPSTVLFRHELSDQESTTSGVTSRQRRMLDVVRYEGQRGWTDSEVDLLYEFIDETDEIFPDLSYQSNEGRLNYGLDFGTELNWHWDSRMRYFDRVGSSDLTTATVDERLWADHTEDLRSEWRYSFARTETAIGPNSTHNAAAILRHQLYESLTTTGGFDAALQSSPTGGVNKYTGRLDLDYLKRLPGNGRLAVDLGAALVYDDQSFEEAESVVSQEVHVASSPFAQPIRLDNPFVVQDSIVVTKTATGPLPPDCVAPPGPPTPLTQGTDYTLRSVNDFTEIVPVPCAGTVAGINAGDTIAVDYSFRTFGDNIISTVSWRAGVSVDYGWIRPFFMHDQANQNLVAGVAEELLDNRLSDRLGVELGRDGRRLRLRILAEAERYRSDRLDFNSVRSTQVASANILPTLTVRVTGEQSLVDYLDQDRRSDTLAARMGVRYAFRPNSVADLSGGIRVLDDTVFPDEQIGDGSLRIRLLFRQLEISPTLEVLARERGDTTTNELRFLLRLVRKF